MQAIMETLFDAAYLVTVVTLWCIMVKSAQDRETKLFGWMAVILGCGDAFHLVPRAWALCTDGLAAHAAALGAGKFITSITMTIFYVILYHIGKRRYGLHIRALTGAVYALAAARIGLCLFPQNAWLSANPPLSWGIWRNVPFALLGALVIVVFLRGARQTGDRAFRWMWLAIVLSFAFYIPVVLWADVVPLVGMLMIPKTCAYVWVVWMGFSDSFTLWPRWPAAYSTVNSQNSTGFPGARRWAWYTRTCSCWERCFSCLPRCFPKSLTGPGKETSGCSTGCTIPGFA